MPPAQAPRLGFAPAVLVASGCTFHGCHHAARLALARPPIAPARRIWTSRTLCGMLAVSAEDLKENGIVPSREAGFTPTQLAEVGFTTADLRAAGFTAAELSRELNTSLHELRKIGYTCVL